MRAPALERNLAMTWRREIKPYPHKGVRSEGSNFYLCFHERPEHVSKVYHQAKRQYSILDRINHFV